MPFLKDFIDRKTQKEKVPGLMKNLRVKTSTSSRREFPLITFIDTPGLSDSDAKFTFEYLKTLDMLAERADLVLFFLDPVR